MRSKKELGDLLLSRKDLFEEGLCEWLHNMYYNNIFSYEENGAVFDLLENNPPDGFIIEDGYTNTLDYYWKEGDINPRVQWIKENLINT